MPRQDRQQHRYRTLYIDTREKATSRIPDISMAGFDMGRLSTDLKEIIEQALAPRCKQDVIASLLGPEPVSPASAFLQAAGVIGHD